MSSTADLVPDLSGTLIPKKSRPGEGDEDGYCPNCNGPTIQYYYEFPPPLSRKFGKPGVWSDPECANEDCAKQGRKIADRKEWERGVMIHRVEALRSRSQLPRRLEGATFDTFDPYIDDSTLSAYGKCLGYASRFEEESLGGRGLYIAGDVGSGKTHLAAAIAQTLMRREETPTLFVTVPELLDALRPSGSSEDQNALYDAARNAELLVMDDIGAERATEWVQERLFIIINHRYRESLPTIYTSNVGPKDLSDALGPRIASRIVETSKAILLKCGDQRIERARREKNAAREHQVQANEDARGAE